MNKAWARMRAVVIVTTVAIVVASTAPAVGDSVSRTDPANDMYLSTDAAHDPTVPSQTNGDIRDYSIDHRPRALVIAATFTDLHQDGNWFVRPIMIEVKIPTSRFSRDLVVGVRESGATYVVVEQGPDDCGATAFVDLSANTARLRVPRTCLDRPRWVRVRLSADAYNDDNPEELFADEAGATGDPDARVYTRRLYRG